MNNDSGEFHLETQLHICERSLLGNMVPWDFKTAPQYGAEGSGKTTKKVLPPALKAKYTAPKPKAKPRSKPTGKGGECCASGGLQFSSIGRQTGFAL
jgi:hypothetical protein